MDFLKQHSLNGWSLPFGGSMIKEVEEWAPKKMSYISGPDNKRSFESTMISLLWALRGDILVASSAHRLACMPADLSSSTVLSLYQQQNNYKSNKAATNNEWISITAHPGLPLAYAISGKTGMIHMFDLCKSVEVTGAFAPHTNQPLNTITTRNFLYVFGKNEMSVFDYSKSAAQPEYIKTFNLKPKAGGSFDSLSVDPLNLFLFASSKSTVNIFAMAEVKQESGIPDTPLASFELGSGNDVVSVTCMQTDNMSRHLFVGLSDGQVVVVCLSSLRVVRSLTGGVGAVSCISPSPNGKYVAWGHSKDSAMFVSSISGWKILCEGPGYRPSLKWTLLNTKSDATHNPTLQRIAWHPHKPNVIAVALDPVSLIGSQQTERGVKIVQGDNIPIVHIVNFETAPFDTAEEDAPAGGLEVDLDAMVVDEE